MGENSKDSYHDQFLYLLPTSKLARRNFLVPMHIALRCVIGERERAVVIDALL